MFSLFQALILGLVQGATEFLPISSSAHLILLPRLLGWQDQTLAFDVVANTGTLVAVVWYFRGELRQLASAALATNPSAEDSESRKLLGWLALATVPVLLAGWLGRSWVATEGRDPMVIAWMSIVFGVLLLVADSMVSFTRRFATRRGVAELRLRDAVLIGVAQAIAVVPGVSRSGVTMTAALLGRFDRQTAARASFLLAIPVGLLAAAQDGVLFLRNILGDAQESIQVLQLLVVFVASAVSGYAVIVVLLAWLRRRSLAVFAAYRIVLGVLMLFYFT